MGKKSLKELGKTEFNPFPTLIIAMVVVLVIAIGSILFSAGFGEKEDNGDEIYTDGKATVVLHLDGSFTATLYQGEVLKGTYEKSAGEIIFKIEGKSATTELVNSILLLPFEWKEGQRQGNGMLRLKK